jgi:single-stranded-DNA-specific exonuclease
MMTQACEMVAEEHPPEPSVIVLAKEGWSQGLCGPAASKVAERFNCPVLLLEACPGGVAKGSARSIEGISIRDGLVACDEILTRYGGHAAAAGLTVATARVGELREALEAYFRGKQRASAAINVDCRATLEEVGNLKSLEAVRELAPFGPGNREPMVLVEGVEHIQTKWIGSDEAHLKLRFKDRQGRAVDAIWFRASELRAKIKTAFKHGAVDLVVEPGINSFAGARTAQMRVVDMREAYKVTVEPEATSGMSAGERSSASRAVDA